MRVPLSWLREFTPVEADAAEVAARLHDVGLLTEQIDEPAANAGIVVGEVVACYEIPGAKNVQLVDVSDGIGERRVVCGAFNFGPGDKVPLALPGAELPNGMVIAEREIASLGVTSYGMLCAEDELGLGSDHSGIMLLDSGSERGTPVAAVLGLDDTVIELEVTPNRPDAMGMLGVAREVATAFDLPLNTPEAEVASCAPASEDLARVTVETESGCPRYVACVVEDIRVMPSPGWLQARLRQCGVRPINNVVDVSNYVMLEFGEPNHVFDLDRLAGHEIVVREASDGEVVQTLDGIDRKMTAGDVLICDADKPVAIGGIMGGENSEVSDSTSRVLIEAANFEAPRILHTSKRLGLRTDASARFARGVDPELPPLAALRVAQLLADIAGGVVRDGLIDVSAVDPEPDTLTLRPARVNRILGTDLGGSEIADLLAPIGIVAADPNADPLKVSVPSWRPDVEREADLIEEVARLYGYNNIKRTLPTGAGRVGGLTPAQRSLRRIRGLLGGIGLDEAHTTAFVSDDDYERLEQTDEASVARRVVIANPLRDEDRFLRTSLVPSLLKAAAYNNARTVRSVRLAEIGRVYFESGDELPDEADRLGIVYSGVDEPGRLHGTGQGRPYDVYDIKGAVEILFAGLGVEVRFDSGVTLPASIHPGRSAGVLIDTKDGVRSVGWLGEIKPSVADSWDIARSTQLAELDVGAIVHAHLERSNSYRSVPSFPPTYYAAAFVVDEGVAAGEVVRVAESAADDLLTGTFLFDVFRGAGIDPDKKSLAFEFTFQSPERTLTDEDVQERIDAMVTALSSTLGATLRS